MTTLWPRDTLRWRLVTDTVMGGVSQGVLSHEVVLGRNAARMRGDVSTENNGGFIQIALDLADEGGCIDASGFTGLDIEIAGNGERYDIRLRTTDLTRPQQSYRQEFFAKTGWLNVRLPFTEFMPHRIDTPFDPRRLKRIGLVAIGRAFTADLAVAQVGLY